MAWAIVLTLLVATAASAAEDRTVLEPGWNMFSPQQDVDVGKQVSLDADQQLPLLNDSRVDNYVSDLGRRLSSGAQGEPFPYTFKVVNDVAINAFALPGGPVYINRGVIEAADNESQLAAVIAHEISHVALRHGTNQVSKASAAQLPLSILGGILGSDSTEAALAQLGANFAVSSILLKYSRTAESQADIVGTQILYDSGYDPRAMGQFFQKIEAQQGNGPVEFFSNHPSPENRIERVTQEVAALGGVPSRATTNSREFDEIGRYLQSLSTPSGQGSQTGEQSATSELVIVSARYGADNRFIDVRQRMQSRVEDGRLDLQVTNSTMGGDPTGRSKTLEMTYRWNNQVHDVKVGEGQRLLIPTAEEVNDSRGSTPDRPSGRFVDVENSQLRIEHPDNWQAHGQGDAMTIAPAGGLIDDGRGNQALAYGVIVNIFEPRGYRYGQQLQGPGFGQGPQQDSATRLERLTEALVQELRLSNRSMRVIRSGEALQVDGYPALSTYLSNESPTGGRETDWLVTMERPDGLLFLVFVAPERDFQRYDGTFHRMLRSVSLPSPAGRGSPTGGQGATSALSIVSARYGADDRFIDVRERMQSRVEDGRLDLQVTNSTMGGDPIGRSKTLEMTYQWNNRIHDVSVREGQRVSIPSAAVVNDSRGSTPDRPSGRFVGVENSQLRIEHPDNWQASRRGDVVTITPAGGPIDDGRGNQALPYRVTVNIFRPRGYGYGQQLQGSGFGQGSQQDSATRLERLTDALVQELRLSGTSMRVIRGGEALQVDGYPALSTYLSNDPLVGSRETDWLVTMERPDGLLFLVFAAPESDFQPYQGTFQRMLRSVRIKR